MLERRTLLVGSGRSQKPPVISLRDLLAMTSNRLFAYREYIQLSPRVPLCVCSLLITLSHTGRLSRHKQASKILRPLVATFSTNSLLRESTANFGIFCVLINFTLNPLKVEIH